MDDDFDPTFMERHINGGRMITRNCVVFKSSL
jgi:hypothetical protein